MTDLEKLVAKQEASFRKEFSEWVRKKRDPKTLDQLQTLLEQGRIYDAIDLMSDDGNYWMLLFLTTYVAGGVLESRKYPFDYRFNPFTNDYVSRQAENFARFMRNSQRQALLELAYREYNAGRNWKEIAKKIGQNVGLSARQQETLRKYEDLLNQDDSLSPRHVRLMVEQRRKKMLASRGELIARNEVGLLVNEAREESFKQGLEAEGLRVDLSTKTWRSKGDERVRFTHTHASLDGQTVPINQPFISISGAQLQRPHDQSAPMRERMNCRCHLEFNRPPAIAPF